MTLSENITNYLISQGAFVVGFADLSDVDLSKLDDNDLNFNVKSGIVFGTPMPTKLIESIMDQTKNIINTTMIQMKIVIT